MPNPERLSHYGSVPAGETEVGERLSRKRIETLRKRPKPEPWVKKDLGIGPGLSCDFDGTIGTMCQDPDISGNSGLTPDTGVLLTLRL